MVEDLRANRKDCSVPVRLEKFPSITHACATFFSSMNEAPAHLLSLEWWLTVVVVGIGVHLAASYLKPRLDKAGGWFSKTWAMRSKKRAYERQLRVALLRGSESRRLMAAQEEMRHLLTAVLLGVMTVLFLLACFFVAYMLQMLTAIGHPPPSPHLHIIAILPFLALLISFGCSIRAIDNQFDAVRIASELREALRTLEE